MNRKQIAEILSRELECVRRHDTPRCNDKDCIHCDLVLDADIIIEAYTEAITLMQNNDWHYPSRGELPPNGGDYLVYIEYEDRGYIRVGQYFGETGWYTDLGEVYGYWTPIAWMPLPPKEEA